MSYFSNQANTGLQPSEDRFAIDSFLVVVYIFQTADVTVEEQWIAGSEGATRNPLGVRTRKL